MDNKVVSLDAISSGLETSSGTAVVMRFTVGLLGSTLAFNWVNASIEASVEDTARRTGNADPSSALKSA